jgi:hypothetical protein
VTVDEEIAYGGSGVRNYTIAQNLTNVISSNTAAIIESKGSFTTTLTAKNGYELSDVIVTMGGVDVTASVYSEGVVSISSVTGNIMITAKANVVQSTAYVNQIPLSLDADGTSIYNGIGYKTGYRLNSSNNEVAATGMCVTGFIPCKPNDVIRIKNVTISGSQTPYGFLLKGLFVNVTGKIVKSYVAADMVADSNGIITLTAPSTSTIQYFRLSCGVIDDSSIITINEEITDVKNYTITQNLTNIISNNMTAIVEGGSSFSTTLTAKDGYELNDIIVTMDGVDVTASVYSDGIISISSVTGNIVITAKATIILGDYTNLLAIATDTDGSVYNGVGYKANSYISSGNISTKSGYYATGFIPVKHGDTLYFKNCGIQAEQSYHRFAAYDANKTYITSRQHNTTASQISSIGTPVYGADGNMIALTITNNYWSGINYVRFCCSYLGEDSIVTVNEPLN